MDQKFFDVPFAFGGDQSVVPDATQPDGSVSFMEGFGFDYQRDLATDPLAKAVDRSATNYVFNVITAALAALQKVGIPEWVTPAQNGGVVLAYPKYAQVRYSATIPATTFETYVSVVDGNTSVPGADNNWQPIASIVAAAADVIAGTSARLPVTPLTLKSYPGNAAQAFNVGLATTLTQAARLSQVGFQNQAVYAIISGTLMVSVNGSAFTSTGASSFVVPATGRYKARVWGAGGGGGSAFNGASATGGAGGGYSEGIVTATAGASVAVAVGLGGTGATGSANGTAGGTTSVGSMSATGGGGGNGSAAGAASGLSVAPGQGSGGSINLAGQPVTSAYQFGSTYVGGGGGGAYSSCPSSISVGTATVAFFPGGGGGGGASNNGGASGAHGLAVIEW